MESITGSSGLSYVARDGSFRKKKTTSFLLKEYNDENKWIWVSTTKACVRVALMLINLNRLQSLNSSKVTRPGTAIYAQV